MDFCLVDCNSFYASCEQVFRPDLRNKPVVVLSNNDGFVIARNQQAKALGIPDLEPYFKVEHILQKNSVTIFSSNFPLYGDLSDRVMTTLREFAPQVEVYSIDEMFLSFSGFKEGLHSHGRAIKNTVWRDVRIPVSVGISSTKTLAKLANNAAKKIPKLDGVCLLETELQRQWLLKKTPVSKVWGVGRRYTRRLADMQVYSAWDLATSNYKILRRRFNVCLERTIAELNGLACIQLEEHPDDKKQIYCTRSFGKKITDLKDLQQAVSVYASRAAEKMRMQKHLGLALHVFIHTSSFEPNYYHNSLVIKLPYPTDDSRIIIERAKQVVTRIYKPDCRYLKAGVGIIDMVSKRHYQADLFQGRQPEKVDKTMIVLDQLNQQFGRNTAFFGAEGVQRKWRLRQGFKSPEYTTKISEIPLVRC